MGGEGGEYKGELCCNYVPLPALILNWVWLEQSCSASESQIQPTEACHLAHGLLLGPDLDGMGAAGTNTVTAPLALHF